MEAEREEGEALDEARLDGGLGIVLGDEGVEADFVLFTPIAMDDGLEIGRGGRGDGGHGAIFPITIPIMNARYK